MKYHRGPSPLYLNSTIYDWLWSPLHPLDSFFYHSYLLLYILSTLRRKWTFSHCSKTTSGLSAFEEYFDDKDGLDRSTTVLDDYTPNPNAYYCTTATFFFGIFGTYVTPLCISSHAPRLSLKNRTHDCIAHYAVSHSLVLHLVFLIILLLIINTTTIIIALIIINLII